MDSSAGLRAYYCLPMASPIEAGWLMLNSHSFKVRWTGGEGADALQIFYLTGSRPFPADQQFRERHTDVSGAVLVSNAARIQPSRTWPGELSEGWRISVGGPGRDRLAMCDLHNELADDPGEPLRYSSQSTSRSG